MNVKFAVSPFGKWKKVLCLSVSERAHEEFSGAEVLII